MPRPSSSPRASLDVASTIGKKDQSLPDGLEAEEKPLGSDELLDELIAAQRRESEFESQLETDILNEIGTGLGGGQATGDSSSDKPPVLVPAMARDIKADLVLPKRARKIRRSRTSSLVEADDSRLVELSHPIPPVLGTQDEREMVQRFTDKVQQCSMPLDTIMRHNALGGKAMRSSCLEELVEVIEGSQQSRFLTNEFLPDLIRLFKANVFRDLPLAPKVVPFEEVQLDGIINSEWDDLNNVYKIMFRILCHQFESTDVLHQLWNAKAIKNMLAVLLDNGVDARERRFAKIILHRTYAKVCDASCPLLVQAPSHALTCVFFFCFLISDPTLERAYSSQDGARFLFIRVRT